MEIFINRFRYEEAKSEAKYEASNHASLRVQNQFFKEGVLDFFFKKKNFFARGDT